ncbi:MAG: hypothetical protein KGQ60_06155 [Planctomycetes bacterium]|nr:hypothetical protein [Planctomycetota bacterium]
MNRGGSWNNEAANCRSANRNRNTPDNRNNNLGFRVALNSNGRKSWMARGGCPGIPDGTVRFPDWLGFGLASETSTRDRVVLVGRLDDRCESSVRSFSTYSIYHPTTDPLQILLSPTNVTWLVTLEGCVVRTVP